MVYKTPMLMDVVSCFINMLIFWPILALPVLISTTLACKPLALVLPLAFLYLTLPFLYFDSRNNIR